MVFAGRELVTTQSYAWSVLYRWPMGLHRDVVALQEIEEYC